MGFIVFLSLTNCHFCVLCSVYRNFRTKKISWTRKINGKIVGIMGATTSFVDNSNIVKAEYVVSEIIGEIKENDYFAISEKVLDEFAMDDPTNGQFDANGALELDEAFKIGDENLDKLQHGYVRKADGSWYIACLTELGDSVNGNMLEWWFRNCDSGEKFRWWHPSEHIDAIWDTTFYAAMPHERINSHYIGHILSAEIKLEGVVRKLQYEFLKPSTYFDVATFPENNITACLLARIYIQDTAIGTLAIGYVVHLVKEIDGLSTLHTRVWMGDIAYPVNLDNFLFANSVNYLTSFRAFRVMNLPPSFARAIWVHCSQEMHCLMAFLPNYFKQTVGERGNRAELQINFMD